ncbi:MAG: restriction endonuclease subunit S [Lactobacillus sp.]|nr:restriction endonuclease subunit S [Lactobacillus sp.]
METKSIGEVSQVNLSQIRRTHEGPISYIDTSSVIYGKFSFPKIYSSVQDAPSRARRLAKSGDTVISTVRPKMCHYGYISSVNEKDIFSTGFVVVHPRRQVIEPYYLYLVLTSDEVTEKLQQIAETSTTTYPSIKPSDITSIDIIIPSRKYQQDVAGIIGAIDEKIVLNQQINKNLLRLCRIQFDRVKLACSSTTDLSNIAVLMMGQSPKGNTYNQKGEGTPLLNGAADFRGGINPSKYTSDPKKVTKPGDYVFGIRATIGLTTKVFGCYAIGRGTGLARSLNSEFDELLYFILEDSFDYFAHAATGSVYLNISRKDFETYSAPAFSGHSQKVFHDFASPLMEKIYQDETQNKKLTQIRDILLPKLLSGSVDLSGIEEAMKNA